jgi:hypothetical protein
MKAIVPDKYGSSEVLELRDIDKPEIGDDEVLLRVRAAAVNPGELGDHERPGHARGEGRHQLVRRNSHD